jgi:hypothetical protein
MRPFQSATTADPEEPFSPSAVEGQESWDLRAAMIVLA